MSDIAISVQNLSKRYRIGKSESQTTQHRSISHRIASPFYYLYSTLRQPDPDEVIWALKDVSFEVKRGEVLGVIGRNGAGKTTLLKILSRITEPTSGRVVLNGRVGSLLEVGTGFHPELTGRENIYLSGAILGMKKVEIDRKLDEIIDFSGVENFMDTPVKRYSSGMRMRLAFSVAAHLEPEILLIDEVLAVGDAEFQKKCLGKMGEVASEGRTVLFVSHNMAAVQFLCDRAILIMNGSIGCWGETDQIIGTYLQEIENRASTDIYSRKDRSGQGNIILVGIQIQDENNHHTSHLISGKSARFIFHLNKILPNTILTFGIYDQFGIHITGFRTSVKGDLDQIEPSIGPSFVCNIQKLLLTPGHFRINVHITCNGIREDHLEAAVNFVVDEGYIHGRPVYCSERAKVSIPHQWITPL